MSMTILVLFFELEFSESREGQYRELRDHACPPKHKEVAKLFIHTITKEKYSQYSNKGVAFENHFPGQLQPSLLPMKYSVR